MLLNGGACISLFENRRNSSSKYAGSVEPDALVLQTLGPGTTCNGGQGLLERRDVVRRHSDTASRDRDVWLFLFGAAPAPHACGRLYRRRRRLKRWRSRARTHSRRGRAHLMVAGVERRD